MRLLWKRLSSALLVLLGASFITFTLARVIPSDPALAYIGPKATAADAEKLRITLGLDQPIPMQYLKYLGQTIHGNWGYSLSTKQSVLKEITDRLPATLELIFFAISFAIVFGVTLGVLAAKYRGRFQDSIIRVVSIAGVSMPAFWFGLLLQLLFAGRLGWFPATGEFDIEVKYDNPIHRITGFPIFDSIISGNFAATLNGLHHIILPALTLAAYSFGLLSRMARANMLEVLSQDYIKVARAYGLSERIIFFKLALRNALPPIVTVAGLSIAYLITGTFFVEQVYNWPGIGSFAVNSLISIDYPAIMGITLLAAIGYLVINFIVDWIQSKLDPRVGMR
ncbi:MAG: ABC transporter permease [Actinobacteria bacterium]|nr:ABC transporter permease [Actinomycetota bacterium]